MHTSTFSMKILINQIIKHVLCMSSFRVFPLPFNGMTDVAHPYRGLSHFSLIPSVEKLGLLRSILIYIYIYIYISCFEPGSSHE